MVLIDAPTPRLVANNQNGLGVFPFGGIFTEQAAPPGGNPPAGKLKLWHRTSDGHMVRTNSAGVTVDLEFTGGGGESLAATLALGNTSGGNNIVMSGGSDTLQFTRTNNLIIDSATIATANRTVTIPDPGAADSFVLLGLAQTLTNKTLTTPTIGSFTNATHDHSDAANGGNVPFSSTTGGNLSAVLAVGTTTGANNIEITDGQNLTFLGATNNLILDGADVATTDRTLTFPDPGANTSVLYATNIGASVQAQSADLDTYAANPLTSGELGELQNIGATTISASQWAFLGGMDQGVATTNAVTFDSATIRSGGGNTTFLVDHPTGESRFNFESGTSTVRTVQWKINAAGSFQLNSVQNVGGYVVNAKNQDFDFSAKGQTDNNLLKVDASTDRVGVGIVAPTAKLHINQTAAASSLIVADSGTTVLEVGDANTIGLYGTTPAVQSSAYTRNATIVEDRTLLASASATTLNNNNVIAALIADLQSRGFIA